MPVIRSFRADYAHEVEYALDEDVARQDDTFWSRQAHRWPFSWQRFTDWWVSRRWVVPRDVTKE